MGADCIDEVHHLLVNGAVGHGIVHSVSLDTVFPVALASNRISRDAVPLDCKVLRGYVGHCWEIRDTGLATVQRIAVHPFQGKPHRADIGSGLVTRPFETGDERILIRINQFAFTLQREFRRSPVNFKRHLVGVRGILGHGIGNILDIDEELPEVFALVRVLVGVARSEVCTRRIVNDAGIA